MTRRRTSRTTQSEKRKEIGIQAVVNVLTAIAILVVHNRAARYIERMDSRTKTQLKAKLEHLAKNPSAMPGVKPMSGEWKGLNDIEVNTGESNSGRLKIYEVRVVGK